jgi:hypothetical protein
MKKNLLYLICLVSFVGFSQSNNQIIQNYLKNPASRTTLSNADFNDWAIQSEGGTTTSGIENCYVVQRYQGIEIFRAVSNFSIKNKQVIDVSSRIVANVSKKVNATTPKLSVTDALVKAYFQLGITAKDKFNILETVGTNKFKVSNGIGITEPVTANLVYHQEINGDLKLAWDFNIHTNQHDHLWSVRIDEITGVLLEKMIL